MNPFAKAPSISIGAGAGSSKSPFPKAPTVSDDSGRSVFNRSQPDKEKESVIGAQLARSEIFMVYDRWSRADTGGFMKGLKAALGVLEDIDIIENFETVTNLKHTELFFDEYIRNRCMRQLKERLADHKAEARSALKSLQGTLAQTETLIKKYDSNSVDERIVQYLTGINESMEKLIDFRLHALDRIERIKSFANEFEEIQFLLLVLAETSADYIPRRAAEKVVQSFPLTPRTLDGLKQGNGSDLFTQ